MALTCSCPCEVYVVIALYRPSREIQCNDNIDFTNNLQLQGSRKIKKEKLLKKVLVTDNSKNVFEYYWFVLKNTICMVLGIPMEEEEEDQDTSIKGRLVALVNKIKGQPYKAEEKPTEKEQVIPCKIHLQQNVIYYPT